MGDMRDRMLRGELYIAEDEENDAEFGRVQELLDQFNRSPHWAWEERDRLLRRALQAVGDDVVVRPPFYCEYGAITIGDRTFVNVDAVMLDVAPITIGAACQLAPRVQLLTATHPIDPEPPVICMPKAGSTYCMPAGASSARIWAQSASSSSAIATDRPVCVPWPNSRRLIATVMVLSGAMRRKALG